MYLLNFFIVLTVYFTQFNASICIISWSFLNLSSLNKHIEESILLVLKAVRMIFALKVL